MVKLDIRRAYDEVKRDFLMKVLANFGFPTRWISWVNGCIGTMRFYVLINGSPQGFFEMEKGIRQGDPLSAFLIIILVKVLGRIIKVKRDD